MLYLSDARSFTEYRSDCQVENELMKQGEIKDAYSYRIYLQKNAEEIMTQQKTKAYNGNYCKSCGKNVK